SASQTQRSSPVNCWRRRRRPLVHPAAAWLATPYEGRASFAPAAVDHPLSRHTSVPFEHTLGKRHDQHLAGGLLEDVVDGRGEEARLAPPPWRRAQHDQVRPLLRRLLDDRLPDRPRPTRPPLD